MDPPKRTNRPMVLLAGVVLLAVLARLQLAGHDSLAASDLTQPVSDPVHAFWAILMLVLAASAATAVAFFVRGRLNPILAIGFAGVVG